MGRDVVIERAGDASTLLFDANIALTDLVRERVGDDLYLHIRNSRDGVQLRDYFTGTGGNAQSWQAQFADGNTRPLDEVLAAIDAPVQHQGLARL